MVILSATAVVLTILIVVLAVKLVGNSSGAGSSDSSGVKVVQKVADADDAGDSDEGDDESDDDADDADAAAKAAAEQETAHEQARAAAVASGEQVFDGIVHVCNGEETSQLLGTQSAFNDSGRQEKERMTDYALLELTGSRSVDAYAYSSMSTITREYSYIQLGKRGANNNDGDTVAPWRAYDGQQVCVAVSDLKISDGVSVVNVPTAGASRLLYTYD